MALLRDAKEQDRKKDTTTLQYQNLYPYWWLNKKTEGRQQSWNNKKKLVAVDNILVVLAKIIIDFLSVVLKLLSLLWK